MFLNNGWEKRERKKKKEFLSLIPILSIFYYHRHSCHFDLEKVNNELRCNQRIFQELTIAFSGNILFHIFNNKGT